MWKQTRADAARSRCYTIASHSCPRTHSKGASGPIVADKQGRDSRARHRRASGIVAPSDISDDEAGPEIPHSGPRGLSP
eukprot:4664281-Pyramimonas_sp.AAC.1